MIHVELTREQVEAIRVWLERPNEGRVAARGVGISILVQAEGAMATYGACVLSRREDCRDAPDTPDNGRTGSS